MKGKFKIMNPPNIFRRPMHDQVFPKIPSLLLEDKTALEEDIN